MSERVQRINKLLQEEIGQIILKEYGLPNILTTITRVECSSSLQQANVFISVLPDESLDRVFKLLNRHVWEIQQQINKKLRMRPIPKIIFVVETETKKAARIEKLLQDAKE